MMKTYIVDLYNMTIKLVKEEVASFEPIQGQMIEWKSDEGWQLGKYVCKTEKSIFGYSHVGLDEYDRLVFVNTIRKAT